MTIAWPSFHATVGALQLWAGQPAGCETAVQAFLSMFTTESSDGVLLLPAGTLVSHVSHTMECKNVYLGIYLPNHDKTVYSLSERDSKYEPAHGKKR